MTVYGVYSYYGQQQGNTNEAKIDLQGTSSTLQCSRDNKICSH